MTLSTSEIESTRHHLGWGNMGVGASPYTQDGFWHTFNQIVSPYLGTGTETSATTAVTANAITAVTPVSMTNIEVNGELVVDTGDEAEIVVVKAADATTFTAKFAKAHATTGYPIATMSGKARLRLLLCQANKAWEELVNVSTAQQAGLRSVDKGDVVWQERNAVVSGKRSHYRQVQRAISSLVRVPVAPDAGSASCSTSLY